MRPDRPPTCLRPSPGPPLYGVELRGRCENAEDKPMAGGVLVRSSLTGKTSRESEPPNFIGKST